MRLPSKILRPPVGPLYTAVLASHLLIPIRNAAVPAPEKRIRAVVVNFRDSEALPAFTGWDAVALWPDRAVPAKFIEFRGQGVFILARSIHVQHVLINPSGSIGIPIGSTEIQILGDGALPGQGTAQVAVSSALATTGQCNRLSVYQ